MSLSSRNNPGGASNNEMLLVFPTPHIYQEGMWEMALSSISFTPDDSPAKPRKARSVGSEASIEQIQHIKYKKDSADLIMFFSGLLAALLPYGIKLVAVIDNGQLFLEVQNSLNINSYLFLPKPLADLFKLGKQQIWKGSFLASGMVAQAEFEQIKIGTEFDILIISKPDYTDNFIVNEYIDSMAMIRAPDTKDYKEFFSQLSIYFNSKGYFITFDFSDADSCKLTVRSSSNRPDDYIELPQSSQTALAFKRHYFPSGHMSQRIHFKWKGLGR